MDQYLLSKYNSNLTKFASKENSNFEFIKIRIIIIIFWYQSFQVCSVKLEAQCLLLFLTSQT